MTRPLVRSVLVLMVLGLLVPMSLIHPRDAAAVAPATDPFQRTWARTDQPVASGAVSRTWMWGPEANTEGIWEDYAESPEGTRLVQYFDKSRMEITRPDAVDAGLWYVTNGLLVVEMMTGEMQTGDQDRVQRTPAHVNVAGDPDDPLTYAILAQRRDDSPLAVGSTVIGRLNSSGQVSNDPGLAGYNVTAVMHVGETNHTVASVFWEFMHSSGLVRQGDQTVTDQLFVSLFYATGFPITEAYWANVKIGGTLHEVLLQCFERRCLTYAPDNPDGWQVEAGNVGQHYHAWRYGQPIVTEPGKRVMMTANYGYTQEGHAVPENTLHSSHTYTGAVTFEFMLTEADLNNLVTYGFWWATGSGHATLHLDGWITDSFGEKEDCGFSWSGPFDATVSFELLTEDHFQLITLELLEILLVDLVMPEYITSVAPSGMCAMDSGEWINPWIYELELTLESGASQTLIKPPPSDAPHHGSFYSGSGWSLQIDID
jgi:hypothetical protein